MPAPLDIFGILSRAKRRARSYALYDPETRGDGRDFVTVKLDPRSLAAAIYALYHARSRELINDGARPNLFSRHSTGHDDHLEEFFGKALVSAYYPSSGWSVRGLSPDRKSAYVEKGGVHLLALPRHLSRTHIRPELCGTVQDVLFPCLERRSRPGFYVLRSRNGVPDTVRYRIYLNLLDQESIASVLGVWAAAGQSGARFAIKVVNSPCRLGRTDSAVIYVGEGCLKLVLRAVTRLVRDGRLTLAPDTSHFALRIRPGIAIAEEPTQLPSRLPESFGQNRAACFADGLLKLPPDELSTPAMALLLTERGVDPKRLHRNL